MKTKTTLLILILSLTLTLKSYSQIESGHQYCFDVTPLAFSECPPGTYFTSCINYTIDCPNCSEVLKCCTITVDNRSCCFDVPAGATNINWTISKFSYTVGSGTEDKPHDEPYPTVMVGSTKVFANLWLQVGTQNSWSDSNIKGCNPNSIDSEWDFEDQYHLRLIR